MNCGWRVTALVGSVIVAVYQLGHAWPVPTQLGPLFSSPASIVLPPGICRQAHRFSPSSVRWEELSLCYPILILLWVISYCYVKNHPNHSGVFTVPMGQKFRKCIARKACLYFEMSGTKARGGRTASTGNI